MDPKPKERFLQKGDEVWIYRIEHWRKTILPRPELTRGVVTGGGPYRVRITWDGERTAQTSSRGLLRTYASPREALEAARQALIYTHRAAIERADQAHTALLGVEDMIAAELLAAAPGGGPEDDPH